MEHEISRGKVMVDVAAKMLSQGSPLEESVPSTLAHVSNGRLRKLRFFGHFYAKVIIDRCLKEQHQARASWSRYSQGGLLQAEYYQSVLVTPEGR